MDKGEEEECNHNKTTGGCAHKDFPTLFSPFLSFGRHLVEPVGLFIEGTEPLDTR